MVSIGVTQEEVEKEFTRSMNADPTTTEEMKKEIAELLGFKKMYGAAGQPEPEIKSASKMVDLPKNKPVACEGPIVTERLLAAPAKHGLAPLLAELKFGRTAQDQRFLDHMIKEYNELSRDEEIKRRIRQKLDLIVADIKQLSYKVDKDYAIDEVLSIKELLDE